MSDDKDEAWKAARTAIEKHKPFRRPSPCCAAPRARDDGWDAYYCTACRAWLEAPCRCSEEDNCPYSEHRRGPRPEKAP